VQWASRPDWPRLWICTSLDQRCDHGIGVLPQCACNAVIPPRPSGLTRVWHWHPPHAPAAHSRCSSRPRLAALIRRVSPSASRRWRQPCIQQLLQIGGFPAENCLVRLIFRAVRNQLPTPSFTVSRPKIAGNGSHGYIPARSSQTISPFSRPAIARVKRRSASFSRSGKLKAIGGLRRRNAYRERANIGQALQHRHQFAFTGVENDLPPS